MTMDTDNPTLRYYDAELRYLREAGKAFAQAFPERAAALHLDKPGAQDPFVERLLEGFAFLTGRLRQKLDDDLPELTESLVSLLWPHYLRTIASLSVVQFTLSGPGLLQPRALAKGFEVLSRPIGPHGTRCRYTTCQALRVLPLVVDHLSHQPLIDGRSSLHLRLRAVGVIDVGELAALRLYINADQALASALYAALLHPATVVAVAVDEGAALPTLCQLAPLGFSPEERLWPDQGAAFGGYQLLLEYFSFPEKFRFFELRGLEQVALAPGQKVDVRLELTQPWPAQFGLNAEHLRTNAVPVANLFALQGDPFIADPLQHEYLIRPQRLQDGHTEIYSVDSVCGQAGETYVPFTSFRHRGGLMRHDAPERYFHTRSKPGPQGLRDTWLILGGEGFQQAGAHALSLALTATNGQLPRRALQTTLLDECAEPLPGLSVRNLCPPSLPCFPPDQDRFQWRVLGHLGSNFLPLLSDPQVLRGTLALYDWPASEMNRRRLQAIIDVRHGLIERFTRGYLQRGVDIQVTLEAAGFAGQGDILLFGEILNRFFSLYADIHVFTQLTVVVLPESNVLRWQEMHSQRVPG